MNSKNSGIANTLYQGLVENSVVGQIVLESVGDRFETIFANSRAREILEIQIASSLKIEDMIPEPDRRGSYVSFGPEVIDTDRLIPEILIRKSNGYYFVASLSVNHTTVEDRRLIMLSFQDISTEKKLSRELRAKQAEIERAYAELLEQNSQLRQLDQAKDKFIALTTHELRTPLSAILATADVLELKLYENDEQRDEFIHTIADQGRHLMELVNDILDFAKIRAGKMDFFIEQINIKKLVLQLSDGFLHMAEKDNITLSFDEPSAENSTDPILAWVDVLRFREIFNNVLSNAIKYNRPNGAVKVSWAEFVNDESQRFARITVSDTGFGIPDDKASAVFNEFETIGNVALHHKGTGLGMPISRRLVESMGGKLTFKSEVGHGTSFFVDIPLDRVLGDQFYRSREDAESDFAA